MLVNHFLEKSAERLPDKVARVCGDQRWTYSAINEAADRLAGALIEMGVRRQDRVVIFLDNSVESVISIFGILKAGAIFIILNPTMKPRKLNYILNDSGAAALICQTNKNRIIKDALENVPDLKHAIWVGPSSQIPEPKPSSPTYHLWNEVLFALPASQPPGRSAPCIDVDLATIIYTSGSTGEPKGVMSAHYNVVTAARSISGYLENVETDIVLNVLPLSFDYGLYQILMTFFFGGICVVRNRP